MNKEKRASLYPQEMPADESKKYDHGAIVDVVQHEINPTSSTNPAKPHNTDNLNTEFAKQALENNL